jgi:hypothetical protein
MVAVQKQVSSEMANGNVTQTRRGKGNLTRQDVMSETFGTSIIGSCRRNSRDTLTLVSSDCRRCALVARTRIPARLHLCLTPLVAASYRRRHPTHQHPSTNHRPRRKVEILFALPVPTMSCDSKTSASPGEIQGRTGAATNKMTYLSDDLNAVVSTSAPATPTGDMLPVLSRTGNHQDLIKLINKLSVDASSPADRESAVVGLLSDAIAKILSTNADAEAEDTEYPAPNKFDGKREDLESFIRACRHATSNPWFIDEQLKIGYVFFYLDSAPAAQAIPFVGTNSVVAFKTVEQLYDLLDRSSGYYMDEQEARRAMLSCKQKNRSFREYHDEMFRYARYAGAFGSDRDGIFLFLFEQGLSYEIRYRLITLKTNRDFRKYSLAEFVAMCEECDAQLRYLEIYRLEHDRQHSQPSTLNTTTALSKHIKHPVASPADQRRTGGRKLSAKEKQRRFDLGLCLYCGGPNHVARGCQKKRRH